MKRYGNIYDKIYDIDNLREAHRNARKDKLFYTVKYIKPLKPYFDDYYKSKIKGKVVTS